MKVQIKSQLIRSQGKRIITMISKVRNEKITTKAGVLKIMSEQLRVTVTKHRWPWKPDWKDARNKRLKHVKITQNKKM